MAPRNRLAIGMLALAGVVGAVFMSGCAYQPYRKQVRQEARDRVDLVNAKLTYDQAMQSFQVGQFDEAMQQVNATIERHDKLPDFHILKGRIYLETQRLEQAVKAFDHAIELAEANIEVADAAQSLTEDQQKQNAAVAAEAHYFAGIVYQRWSDHERSFRHYMAAYEHESTRVHYLLAAVESMIGLHRLDEAEDLLRSRMTYFEHNAAMRHLLGQIAALRGDAAGAAALYAQARRLNPDDLSLLEELAYARYAAGQFSGALEAVRQLQQVTPAKDRRVQWRHLEARCLVQLERIAEARSHYLALSRSQSEDVEVWIELGMLAWELGDFRRVATSSVRVMAMAPQRYEGYMLKAVNEQHQGNVAEAIALMREAVGRASETAFPHLLLGHWLEDAGKPEEAFRSYSRASRIEPNSAEAARSLARLMEWNDVVLSGADASDVHE